MKKLRLAHLCESRRVSELGTLCGSLGLKKAVGVSVYKINYAVMKFRVGVTYSTALYDPTFCQRKFDCLYAVPLSVMCRKDY